MAAAKKVSPKKVARKKKPPATRARPATKKTAAGVRRKKAAVPRTKTASARRKSASALGRVRVQSAARLDLVFQKDYQAREIFGFLKIETIAELEQFGPDEIIERLAGPMMQTVLRIRKTLAMANRHLAKDEKFAKAFLAEVKRTQQ
jgi:hypothetical protein